MRKVVLFMVLSVDGFVCGENDELDWEVQDPEVSRYLLPPIVANADTMLLGRKLYQGFEQAWPPMAKDESLPQDLRDFANWIEATPKLVFSSTLGDLSWQNSIPVSIKSEDDIAQRVQEQKDLDGRDLILFGGAQFAQTLVARNLVDEYIFKMQPVALGKGKALFGNLQQRKQLQLLESKSFASGVVTLRYQNAA